MSINVNVSGNPVNIKRGKMVTSDPYTDKREFEKRRLLRLEQVRQQSKDLAQDVRNKVRREKKKQMGEIEEEGKEKLQSWQNRKLLELQSQYRDALDKIGLGHKEAEELGNESDILTEEKLRNEEIARNRGRQAENKLQVQKNEENYKKAKPVQHKKLVRDIENTRAALVSCMKKTSKCQNKTKKPKTLADINITIPDDSDFEEESSSTDRLSSIQEENCGDSEGFCECSDKTTSSETPPDNTAAVKTSAKERLHTARIDTEIHKNQHQPQDSLKSMLKLSQDLLNPEPKQKSYQQSIDDRKKLIEDFRNRPRDAPLDTRISDRIKRRQHLASQPDFCDDVADPASSPEVRESCRIREKICCRPEYSNKIDEDPIKDPLELSDECICSKFHTTCPCQRAFDLQNGLGEGEKKSKCSCGYENECGQNKTRTSFGKTQSDERPKQKDLKSTRKGYRPEVESSQRISNKTVSRSTEIPSKPSVKLKVPTLSSNIETRPSDTTSTGAYRVRHYDYPNRFEKEIPSTSQVEKITADSLEVVPNADSEAEWQEKMKQRDKDAQMRGKRALEKEKVQRDYEDMMKKLPILQRKEHIAQIGLDKPEYHMSEERLKQRERERQNRLENAFSQAIPELKPQIITIPSRKHDIPTTNEPFEILDGEDSRTLNLGNWDIEIKPKKMFSAEEVQEIIKSFTLQKPEDRKTRLKQLLKSLKLQKEQLLNEIKSLPKDDSINALISDLNSFSDSDESNHKKSKHKKKDKDKDKKSDERKRTREDSDTSNTSSDIQMDDQKAKVKDHHKTQHGKSPSKKMKKSKPKVLVLQNSSTQTTPKPKKMKNSSSSGSSETTSDSQKQTSSSVEPGKFCSQSHVVCDCTKETKCPPSNEVCQIVIKLNEDEYPKVEVVRGARDKRGVSTGSEMVPVQGDRSRKSPRKERDRSSSKDMKRPKSSEKEKKLPKESAKEIGIKHVAAETDTFREPLPKVQKKRKPSTQLGGEGRRSPSRKRDESWKEHLSKNSMSTSSTSYFSPPDFSRVNTTASTEASKQSLYNLRKKPQQTNFDRSSSLKTSTQRSFDQSAINKDQRLLNYIQRLLAMSKVSVDELGVSSSDVQTPSQSIIEMETNNPMAPLHNIIKYINVRAADINELSMSPDATVPPNSAINFPELLSKDQLDKSEHLPEKDSNGTSSSKTKESIMNQYTDVTDSCSRRIANLAAMIEQLREEKLRMIQSPPIPEGPDSQRSVLDRGSFQQPLPCDRDGYGQDRNLPISEQAVGIGEGSDKDNSTRYFDFPPSGEKSKGTNSTASLDEEELNRRLFEIDMSLAAKLKKFRQPKDDKSADSSRSNSGHDEPVLTPPPEDQQGQDFLNRLQRLVEENHENEQLAQRQSLERSQSTQRSSERQSLERLQLTQRSSVPFIPLLVDIPKLPILEPQPEGAPLDYPSGSEKRHPPPSKGLITAKKFNGNISLVPHELSTIVEADSQLSTRISPNTSKTCTSPGPPLIPTLEERSLPINKSPGKVAEGSIASIESLPSSEHRSVDEVNDIPKDRSKSERTSPSKSRKTLPSESDKSTTGKSVRCVDFTDSVKSLTCNEATCASLTSLSSSSTGSNMASIEAMLRSIGMDWAIPTLHKTEEALALASSSSSGDLSCPGRGGCKSKSNSSSEVSLKDFLKKQMISKISSSSLNKSDASPVSFMQACSEISAIQPSSSAEKGRQRTSTPLLSSSKNTSKTKEDQQQLFTSASDISSVRNSSREASSKRKEPTFHSVGSGEELSSKDLVK